MEKKYKTISERFKDLKWNGKTIYETEDDFNYQIELHKKMRENKKNENK